MQLTAGTNSLNKKQMNGSVKRSRSMNIPNIPSKYFKSTVKINAHEYFSHERPFANVKVNFQQQIIWCDKALLAAASPILCEQLLKLSPKDEYLTLNDIQLDEFLLLLEFIYPLFNPEINEQNITMLIKLSHRFQFGSREFRFEKTKFSVLENFRSSQTSMSIICHKVFEYDPTRIQ